MDHVGEVVETASAEAAVVELGVGIVGAFAEGVSYDSS